MARRRAPVAGSTAMDPIELAIFDFDGTLANSIPWLLSILNDIADAHGFPHVTPEDVDLLRGFSPIQVSRHFGVPMWRVPAIGADVRRRMAADIGAIPLFDGVPELLRSLWDRDIVLAIVSSNTEDNVRAVIGPELAALVDHFECGVSLMGKTPKLRHVMTRCGVPPARALYVGDEIRDIEAAHAAGARSGAVTWGYNHTAALRSADPTVVFERVSDIADYAAAAT